MNNLHLTIYTLFVKSFTYKKGALAILSIPTSIAIEQFLREGSFFGISLMLYVLLFILIVIDFITGIAASKRNNQTIKSNLLANTIYKVIMTMLFFWILHEVNSQLDYNIDHKNPEAVADFVYDKGRGFIRFIRTFMFILIIFREWVSIGENSERLFNKKFYIFSLTTKIFEIIEKNFLNKVEDSNVCGADGNDSNKRGRSDRRRDMDDYIERRREL